MTARRKVDVNVRVDVSSRCLLVVMSSVREIDFEVCVLRFVLFGSVDERKEVSQKK